MDEFVHYQALGCAAYEQSAAANVYRESCAAMPLRLPGTATFLPLRSYAYIGSLPVVTFFPFWLVLGAPWAVRVHGAVLLALIVLLAARLSGGPPRHAALAMALLPTFVAAVVMDIGPLGLQLVLVLAALRFLVVALGTDDDRRGALMAAAAGLMLALAFWIKMVVAWTFPAIALTALRAGGPSSEPAVGRVARRWRILAVATLCFAIPVALLLASRDREGATFLEVISAGGASVDFWAARRVLKKLVRLFLDGSAIAARGFVVPSSPFDVGPALASLGVVTAGIAARREGAREISWWLACAILTLLVVTPFSAAWGPHHLAFAIVFYALALTRALAALPAGRPLRLASRVLAAAFWVHLLARLPGAAVDPNFGREKDALVAAIRASGLDEATVQVHVSWGSYYMSHLFGGRRQAVLYVSEFPEDPRVQGAVEETARQMGRPVLVVGEDAEVSHLAGRLGDPSLRFGTWSAATWRPAPTPDPP
jgi:hypothetical protein